LEVYFQKLYKFVEKSKFRCRAHFLDKTNSVAWLEVLRTRRLHDVLIFITIAELLLMIFVIAARQNDGV